MPGVIEYDGKLGDTYLRIGDHQFTRRGDRVYLVEEWVRSLATTRGESNRNWHHYHTKQTDLYLRINPDQLFSLGVDVVDGTGRLRLRTTSRDAILRAIFAVLLHVMGTALPAIAAYLAARYANWAYPNVYALLCAIVGLVAANAVFSHYFTRLARIRRILVKNGTRLVDKELLFTTRRARQACVDEILEEAKKQGFAFVNRPYLTASRGAYPSNQPRIVLQRLRRSRRKYLIRFRVQDGNTNYLRRNTASGLDPGALSSAPDGYIAHPVGYAVNAQHETAYCAVSEAWNEIIHEEKKAALARWEARAADWQGKPKEHWDALVTKTGGRCRAYDCHNGIVITAVNNDTQEPTGWISCPTCQGTGSLTAERLRELCRPERPTDCQMLGEDHRNSSFDPFVAQRLLLGITVDASELQQRACQLAVQRGVSWPPGLPLLLVYVSITPVTRQTSSSR